MKEARVQRSITDIYEAIYYIQYGTMRTAKRKIPPTQTPRNNNSMSNSPGVNSSELNSLLYVPLNSFIFIFIVN